MSTAELMEILIKIFRQTGLYMEGEQISTGKGHVANTALISHTIN
jgi:hypothetical protein